MTILSSHIYSSDSVLFSVKNENIYAPKNNFSLYDVVMLKEIPLHGWYGNTLHLNFTSKTPNQSRKVPDCNLPHKRFVFFFHIRFLLFCGLV